VHCLKTMASSVWCGEGKFEIKVWATTHWPAQPVVRILASERGIRKVVVPRLARPQACRGIWPLQQGDRERLRNLSAMPPKIGLKQRTRIRREKLVRNTPVFAHGSQSKTIDKFKFDDNPMSSSCLSFVRWPVKFQHQIAGWIFRSVVHIALYLL
jgi:hypothetical protein